MKRLWHVEGTQTPRVRVWKILGSDSKKERRKIGISRVRVSVRKLCDWEDGKIAIPRIRIGNLLCLGFEDDKIAIPRVRVLPNMPSVGMRRSTRVFVLKSIAKTASDADSTPGRVLRSGKRRPTESFADDKLGEGVFDGDDEWLRCCEQKRGRIDAMDGSDESPDACIALTTGDRGEAAAGEESVVAAGAGVDQIDKFGIVYSRKRRRRSAVEIASESGVLKDRMYGTTYARKRRNKEELVVEKPYDFFVGLDHDRRSNGPLLISAESSWSSLCQFSLFLVSVLGWMMSRSWSSLSEFTSILSAHLNSTSIFGLPGIRFRFEPNWILETHVACRNSFGICRIYGARSSIPLISVNFAALPFFFTGLHLKVHLGYHYLPDVLERFLMGFFENSERAIVSFAERDFCIPLETVDDSRKKILYSGIHPVERNVADSVVEVTEYTVQNVARRHSSRFRKYQKKRSSARLLRSPKNHCMSLQACGSSFEPTGMKLNSVSELSPVQDAVMRSPNKKSLEMYGNDLFRVRDDHIALSSPRVSLKQKRSARYSPAEKTKEVKSALVDLKQNIDSARCSANILVIESDRCWREDGAEVTLECSGSKKWQLVVKIQGSVKYLYKAQEMKSSTNIRYTPAMTWTGEDGWKLEFCDRQDWLIFKELHRECSERNAQAASVRIIPIPVVQEVMGYADEYHVPFFRPDVYISVRDDEVERALMSENAYYDMDSEDEAWLEQLNCNYHDIENDDVGHILYDIFEKIIFILEKAAYSHPDDVSDVDMATKLCIDLGKRDMVAAVFEHWSRKRKQKQSALVKVFQGPPPKRAQVIPKHFLRKKRSFKRQASQVGRGKPEIVLRDMAEQEAQRRIQAERAAASAMESAALKRRKAQELMQKADLAMYKAVMALRYADAAQAGKSVDFLDSELNGDDKE